MHSIVCQCNIIVIYRSQMCYQQDGAVPFFLTSNRYVFLDLLINVSLLLLKYSSDFIHKYQFKNLIVFHVEYFYLMLYIATREHNAIQFLTKQKIIVISSFNNASYVILSMTCLENVELHLFLRLYQVFEKNEFLKCEK